VKKREHACFSKALALCLFLVAIIFLAISPHAFPSSNCELNLPPGEATMWVNVNEYNECRDLPLSSSLLDNHLSNIGSGFSIENGMYNGFCADLHGTILDHDSPWLADYAVRFFSSLDPSLPIELKWSGRNPSSGDPIPWNKINYVLNTYSQESWLDVQAAIWSLVHGCNLGAQASDAQRFYCTPDRLFPYPFPYGPSPDGCVGSVNIDTVRKIAAAANTSGNGFVPGPGDKIAVVVDITSCTGNSFCDDPFQVIFIPLTCCSGAIGDYVWYDSNRNGLQDAGEPGIDGVTVNLKDSSGTIIATTTTDTNGYYQFAGRCPGTYVVEVDQTTLPRGSSTSICNAERDDAVDSDSDNPDCSPRQTVTLTIDNPSNDTIDFGFVSPCTGSIGDFVWQDLDGNGVQDDGEPGVPNVVVRLFACDKTLEGETTTDADGRYSFDGLCGPDYFVEFVLPPGKMFTASNQGGDPAEDSNADQWTGQTACFTLGPNEDNPTIAAGLVGQDLCPPTPIPGFTDTKAGTLYVWQDDQYVHVIYDQSPGLNDNSYGTTRVNWPRDRKFGDLVGSDKAEFIFFDNNGNKVLDFFADYITAKSGTPSGYASLGPFGGDGSCVSGDCAKALVEWSTSLADNLNDLGYCSGGTCKVTTPDGVVVGDLKIDSPPTTSPTSYALKYPDAFPNGWNFTNSYYLTLNKSFFTTGLTKVEVGLVHNSPPKAGTNAIDPVPCEPTGPAECGLSAADPTTKDKQLKQGTTNTGSAKATMTGVTISWPPTNGYLSKVKFDGDVIWDGTIKCGTTCSATLTSSQLTTDVKKKSIDPGKTRQLIFEFEKNASTNLSLYTWTVDFGPGCSVSLPPGPPCGGMIGDFVWNDTNGNGLQDTGEPGIAGVSLTLKMGGALKATTTTSASGNYQFTGLCAGTYTVEVTTPFGFVPTTPCSSDQTIGNDSNCSPATVDLLTDNGSNLTIDFGFKSSGPGDGILMCPATPIQGFSGPVGVLFVTVDSNGDVTVRYDQSRGLNDNSFGINIVQWPRSHSFNDLLGSDNAQFMFYDKNGSKVLDFYLDYLHAKSGAPSGYASLGPDGGDGSMVSGTRSNILAWTTSLADNLNTTGYCSGGNCSALGTDLLQNSPPTVSSSSYELPAGSPYGSWNFTNSYSVKISHLAFPTGFGRVAVGVVHDSPPKVGSNAVYPVPCQ
jgi:hypothetical protein